MESVNQQERLSTHEERCWFLAGFIEGEGSLCVSIKNHPSSPFGFLVDPEFFLYQHEHGIQQLHLAREIFGTGRIARKVGNEKVLVFSIASRRSLMEKIVPFYENYMRLSAKWDVFLRFKDILESFEREEHKTRDGLALIIEKAYGMNPGSKGKKRKRTLQEVLDRILRDYTLDSSGASNVIRDSERRYSPIHIVICG
ncbi:MAG: LAGLIDADG family homing endonuclease [Chlamydiae bacterium]|nr:LAGLIDADG family homing endonuclease [Chlamydiota bacterium]